MHVVKDNTSTTTTTSQAAASERAPAAPHARSIRMLGLLTRRPPRRRCVLRPLDRAPAGALPAQVARTPRGNKPAISEREDPVIVAASQHWCQPITAIGSERGAAGQGEGDVSTQHGAELEQGVSPEVGAPERVTSEQCC